MLEEGDWLVGLCDALGLLLAGALGDAGVCAMAHAAQSSRTSTRSEFFFIWEVPPIKVPRAQRRRSVVRGE